MKFFCPVSFDFLLIFSAYMTVNVAYTLYNTGQRNERNLTEPVELDKDLVARAQEIARGK